MLLEEIYLGTSPRLVLKYLRFIFEVGIAISNEILVRDMWES